MLFHGQPVQGRGSTGGIILRIQLQAVREEATKFRPNVLRSDGIGNGPVEVVLLDFRFTLRKSILKGLYALAKAIKITGSF